MKKTIYFLLIITLPGLFSQCKKNSTPVQPSQDDQPLTYKWPYIIRTKFLCNDGRAFVLRSASNYETLQWEPVTRQQLDEIKADNPNSSNPYIWKFDGAVFTGMRVATLPGYGNITSTFLNARKIFSIYQQGDDNVKRYLVPPTGTTTDEDHTSLGIGPSHWAFLAAYEDEDLKQMDLSVSRSNPTDSTIRLESWGTPHWWYLSLPTDPDDVCDDFNASVIWRSTFICPNSTVIGGTDWWKFDHCAVSQLVLEKVE